MTKSGGAADRLEIRSIRCEAHLGASARERDRLQPVEVDVDLVTDLAPAAATDRLADAVDYAAVVSLVEAEVRQAPAVLIETVAERLCRKLLEDDRITEVGVTVRKFPADLAERVDWVAASIRRRR